MWPPHQMQLFRDVLYDSALQDLHCTGEVFTWANWRRGTNLILERLHRFVGALKWRLLFPMAYAQSLKFFHSDHRPLYRQMGYSHAQGPCYPQHNHPMVRFEAGWLMELDCAEMVVQGWRMFDASMALSDRIYHCLQTLDRWAGAKFRTLPNQIKKKRAKLNELTCYDKWIQ